MRSVASNFRLELLALGQTPLGPDFDSVSLQPTRSRQDKTKHHLNKALCLHLGAADELVRQRGKCLHKMQACSRAG